MPVKIRELAQQLNLSITTVSRALDGYNDVSPVTRQRVILAAQEMGYQPSSAARQLRRKRADTIGYILPTRSPRFSDPFYTMFFSGICDEAAGRQIDLMVTSSPPDSDNEKNIYRRWFESQRADGFIINRIRKEDWRIDFMVNNHIPFVTLGRPLPEQNNPRVVLNEHEGFKKMVRHLTGKGHRRIAYIGTSPNLIVQIERQAGYQEGLKEAGITPSDSYIVIGDLTEEGGYQAARQLLQLPQPPTAILACNDLTALGTYRAIREAGKRVGSDVAVSGSDGIKEGKFADPPLSTLYQPIYEIGRQLTSMLLTLINKGTVEDPEIHMETEIIIRESTG
jgi:LacI family transcriptional regulator